MKRGAFEFSFPWLFAIVVGIVILFFAIYASTKIIRTGQYEIDTSTAKQIGVITNPLESSFESSTKSSMTFRAETRIYNLCTENGNFGEQKIKLSQKSFNSWPEPGAEVRFFNKYFFSEDIAEGRDFYLFSKPFEFPFKVADLIIIIPKDDAYCFTDAPASVEYDLSNLGMENIYFENCTDKMKKVCFSGNCDIYVDYNSKYINKGSKIYFSDDALMYAGIFSGNELYECQLKRLMKRVEQLSSVYRDKAMFIESRCSSNLNADLAVLSNLAKAMKSSKELENAEKKAEELKEKNQGAVCKLW